MNLDPQDEAVTIQLRRAVREDQKRIRQLVHQAGINRLNLDWRRFWIACDPNNSVVGVGQIKPHRDGSMEIASLVVTPDWRGRGIARKIIARLIQDSSTPLWLLCRSDLVDFYGKFGFRTVTDLQEMPPYFKRIFRFVGFFGVLRGRPFPLSIMQLEVSP
jgi:amino-acid N-acetyltransferase